MDYRVLIFMAKNRLAAIDIDGDDVADVISLDGNDVMVYMSKEQIKEFCEHIKEYYNIDQFSDLKMEISILRFDAVMKDAFMLMNFLQEGEACVCNLVSVEKLLPWIAMKEGLLKAGTTIQIKTFDLVYAVALDKDLVLQCRKETETVGKELPFDFPKEKFAEYYHLSKKNLFDYEEEKREWQKKIDDAMQEKERQIGELKKQLQATQKKLKKSEDNLLESQRDLNERLSNANRQICYLRSTNKEKDKICTNDVNRGSDALTYSIMHCFNTGAMVEKGTKIAMVTVKTLFDTFLNSWGTPSFEYYKEIVKYKFDIKAGEAGRLFWLHETVTEGIAYGDAIAVIGNESDTKADVMKWYREMSEEDMD